VGYYPANYIGGTTDGVWGTWNTQYVGYDCGTTLANTTVWMGWNQAYQMGVVTTMGTAGNVFVTGQWSAWNQKYIQFGSAANTNYVQGQWAVDERTPEQIAADNARAEKEQRERRERQLLAKKKAEAALKSTLSKRQAEQLEKDGAFELEVGERLYRIRPGSRVERLCPKTKKLQSYFCIHPHNAHEMPAEDTAISQKLLLEAAEAEFLRLANETRVA